VLPKCSISPREPDGAFEISLIRTKQVYHAFDTIAKRKRIFKVETIGDVSQKSPFYRRSLLDFFFKSLF